MNILHLYYVKPKLVELGKDNDYFVNEQVTVWEIDSFWGLPQYSKVNYYRGNTKVLSTNEGFFEFVVPMTPQTWLENEIIEAYSSMIINNNKPTALAISILDIRQPATYQKR